MIADVLPWLVLLVVIGLWMLGAHNRVTALRGAILAAWTGVDAALVARGQVLASLLQLAAEPLAGEPAAVEAVAAAQADLQSALDAARRRPAQLDAVAVLAKADAVLTGFSLRLLALVEHDRTLRDDPPAKAALQALREVQPRLAFARQTFNEAGRRYNAALQQFPTRLLVPVFRLGPAGQL